MQSSIPAAVILQMGKDEVLGSEVAAPGSPCVPGQGEGERRWFVTPGRPASHAFVPPGLGPTPRSLCPVLHLGFEF